MLDARDVLVGLFYGLIGFQPVPVNVRANGRRVRTGWKPIPPALRLFGATQGRIAVVADDAFPHSL
jgi:hypothetical protein